MYHVCHSKKAWMFGQYIYISLFSSRNQRIAHLTGCSLKNWIKSPRRFHKKDFGFHFVTRDTRREEIEFSIHFEIFVMIFTKTMHSFFNIDLCFLIEFSSVVLLSSLQIFSGEGGKCLKVLNKNDCFTFSR